MQILLMNQNIMLLITNHDPSSQYPTPIVKKSYFQSKVYFIPSLQGQFYETGPLFLKQSFFFFLMFSIDQILHIQQNLMSMIQQTEIQSSVYLCTFECIIRQANISMKFPCSYFATWSTPNGKVIVKTEKHNPKQNLVTFQEKIILTTELIYDNSKVQFLKRQTLVQLFLVSKSRPDQNKLVGRVTIDLAKVINVNMYAEPTEFRLNFCSVEGSVIMQFKAHDRKLTTLSVQSLDRSSFMEYISRSALRGQSKHQGVRNVGNSVQKQNQQIILTTTDYQAATPTLASHKLAFLNDNERQKPKLNKISLDNDIGQLKKNIDSLKNSQTIRQSAGLNKVKQNKISSQGPALFEKNALNLSNQFNDSLIYSKQRFPSRKEQSVQPPKRQNKFLKSDKSKEIILISPVPQIKKQTKDGQNQDFQFLINKENTIENSFFDGRCKMLEEELNQSQRKIEELEQRYKMAEKDKKRFGEANAQLAERINELMEEEKRMTEEKKNVYQTLTNKDKILNQMTDQITQKSEAIFKMELQRSSLKTKIQNYVHEVQYLRKVNERIQSLELKNIQLLNRSLEDKKKIEESEEKTAKLQNIIKDLKESNLKFSQEVIKEQQAKNTIVNKLSQVQNQNMALKTAIQSLKQNGDSSVKIYQKQRENQILQLQEDIGKRNEEIYSLKLIESYLRSQNDTILAEFQQQQSKCGELQFIVLQQKQKNQQLTLKLELFDQKRMVQNKSSKNLDAQNARQNQQISSLKAIILNHELQKSQIQNVHSTKLRDAQQIIQNLSRRLQSAEQKNKDTSLVEENSQLHQRIEVLQNQIIELSNNEQIFQLNQEIAKLKDKISILHDNISHLEKEKSLPAAQPRNNNYGGQTINEGQDNWQNRCLQNEMMINKLNMHLQDQINQNNELEEAVIRYMDKEVKMKETLTVLQRQSKEIYGLVQEKQQNQIMYQKMITQLQRQVDQLKNMINNGSNISPLKHEFQYEHFQSSFPSSESKDVENQQIIKFREHLTVANEELCQQNKKLQQINDQLNEEIITMNIFHNQSINKFQTEISRLTSYSMQLESSLQQSKQIVSVKYRQFEQSLNKKNIQIEIWKSKSKNKQNQALAFEEEVGHLKNALDEIEQEKFGLESINNEKDIRIMELQQSNQILLTQMQVNKMTPKQESLIEVLAELKQKIVQNRSNIHNHWQSLLQNCLDKSMVGEEATKMFNLEQKSRLLSKELHKLKSQMLKTDWRNQHEKITFMGLFKKCQTIVSELIIVVESMNTNQSSFL